MDRLTAEHARLAEEQAKLMKEQERVAKEQERVAKELSETKALLEAKAKEAERKARMVPRALTAKQAACVAERVTTLMSEMTSIGALLEELVVLNLEHAPGSSTASPEPVPARSPWLTKAKSGMAKTTANEPKPPSPVIKAHHVRAKEDLSQGEVDRAELETMKECLDQCLTENKRLRQMVRASAKTVSDEPKAEPASPKTETAPLKAELAATKARLSKAEAELARTKARNDEFERTILDLTRQSAPPAVVTKKEIKEVKDRNAQAARKLDRELKEVNAALFAATEELSVVTLKASHSMEESERCKKKLARVVTELETLHRENKELHQNYAKLTTQGANEALVTANKALAAQNKALSDRIEALEDQIENDVPLISFTSKATGVGASGKIDPVATLKRAKAVDRDTMMYETKHRFESLMHNDKFIDFVLKNKAMFE